MSDFKNVGLEVKGQSRNIPTFECSNCDLDWTESPAGDDSAISVHTEKKVKHAVRFHTSAESIWIKRAKEANKNVVLEFSWGRKKKEKITAGEKWARVDLGKPKQGFLWIVEIELKAGDAVYVYPFVKVVDQ